MKHISLSYLMMRKGVEARIKELAQEKDQLLGLLKIAKSNETEFTAKKIRKEVKSRQSLAWTPARKRAHSIVMRKRWKAGVYKKERKS